MRIGHVCNAVYLITNEKFEDTPGYCTLSLINNDYTLFYIPVYNYTTEYIYIYIHTYATFI